MSSSSRCWHSRAFAVSFMVVSAVLPVDAEVAGIEIHQMVRDGEMELARKAVTAKPDLVRKLDGHRRTPLHWACRIDNLTMVRFLVASGAAVNAQDEYLNTPLHYLAHRDLGEAMDVLIGAQADVNLRNHEGMTPLHSAAAADAVSAARRLIAATSGLDARNVRGRTPLILGARERGGAVIAGVLVDAGCDVNVVDAYGSSALDLAAWRGKRQVVNLLLDSGAKIPVAEKYAQKLLREAASNGLTRLFAAALAAGLKPEFELPSGGTLAHEAAAGGSLDVLRKLTSLGFEIDRQDRYGWTPLHYAARNGRSECAEWLIGRDAATDSRNAAGQSPFNVAEEMGAEVVAEILSSAGADMSPDRFPVLRGPYLGQAPPDETPRRFAGGIVSSIWNLHSAVSFSPKGDLAMWAPMIQVPGKIYSQGGVKLSRRVDGEWSAPEWAEFTGAVDGDVPFIAPDGRRVYFISTRPDPENGSVRERIWYADRRGSGWSVARPVDEAVNDLPIHWQFSVDAESSLYVSLDLPTGLGGGDIFCSNFEDGAWTAPVPLGPPVNTSADEATPFIAPDGSYLLFQRDGDLYMSVRSGTGTWGPPQNLGEPINSDSRELCPLVSPDGKYLFFLSNRGGVSHVWWVRAGFLPAELEG